MLESYKFELKAAISAVSLGILINSSITAGAAPPGTIKIDGSSTLYPITQVVAENFQAQRKGVARVVINESGTGPGFSRFCRGEIDIANASRPIGKKEMRACSKGDIPYVELPVAFGAVTVIVNAKNDWSKTMTTDELKKMWEPSAQGAVVRWSQVNARWPHQIFHLNRPGPGSGSFAYFTEAIIGKANFSRRDVTSFEDHDGVVRAVAGDKDALGLVGFGYFQENADKVRAVAIDDGRGGGVLPSEESIEDGTYQPLSRPVFIYVNMKAAEKPEVKEFVEFYMKNASVLVKRAQNIPLPPRAYTANLEFFRTKRLGTVFDGFLPVGLTIDDLLQREARLYEN